MSYPPQGLGKPPSGAPDMRAPVPEPHYRSAFPVTSPPNVPPTGPPPLPPDEPPRDRSRWAWLSGLAVVAVVGLVTAVFVIGDSEQPDSPSPDAAAESNVAIECEPGPAPEGEKLNAEQFYEDKVWTSSDDEEITADRKGNWDYSDCCDIGLGQAQEDLNDLGCSYGIEAAYESADGHMGIAQLILAFGDTGSAVAAADGIEFTSFRLHKESGIYDDSMEVYGYVQPSGDFLVLTIGCVDTDDSAIVSEAQDTLEAFHLDYTSTLPF